MGRRSGFARLTAEVALGRVGIVFGLEVSCLGRNHADWYRLFDLCGVTDTLVGDGVYDPALFNDRLILGLKGIMAEAELHVLQARLKGGNRQQGGLRRTPPSLAGELRVGRGRWRSAFPSRRSGRQHPPHGLHQVHRTGIGSQGLALVRSEGLSFPLRRHMKSEIRWVAPTYTAIHSALTHPVYAGAYVYGRCHH
jgi:hypothetical protein